MGQGSTLGRLRTTQKFFAGRPIVTAKARERGESNDANKAGFPSADFADARRFFEKNSAWFAHGLMPKNLGFCIDTFKAMNMVINLCKKTPFLSCPKICPRKPARCIEPAGSFQVFFAPVSFAPIL
jgi:hypothetical protein